jgi:hypothetical protein
MEDEKNYNGKDKILIASIGFSNKFTVSPVLFVELKYKC